jgi:hypothetical protein
LIIFGFLPQSSKAKAVAVNASVQQTSRGGPQAGPTSLDDLDAFRGAFYDCLSLRADALFELTDAVLCVEGPVSTLVGLTLTAEHRRGRGGLYDGLGSGRIEVGRLRRSLVSLPVPRDAPGRITLAVDVSPWLRPDAATSPDRSFCHVYGRGKGQAQMIPGWPYSFVAALEPGRTSWTALLDALRLGPHEEATTVTTTQLRAVIHRLQHAGQHKPGDADILIVFDAGYDVTLWGPNIGFGLDQQVTGARVRSCCDVVLAGKSVEDGSAVNLVIGQVDHVWRLGLGLGRCELRQCPVWPCCVEMVQVVGEDPA